MMDDSGDRVEEHVEALDGGQQDEGDPKSNEGSQKPDEQGKAPEPKGIRNDEAHLVPSRYWFASSAFPMIAATLGPVASAFSVCALVRPWRQNFPPGSDIDTAQFIDDPIWYVAFILRTVFRRIDDADFYQAHGHQRDTACCGSDSQSDFPTQHG